MNIIQSVLRIRLGSTFLRESRMAFDWKHASSRSLHIDDVTSLLPLEQSELRQVRTRRALLLPGSDPNGVSSLANTVSVANDHDRKLRPSFIQPPSPINHYLNPKNCNHNSLKFDVLRFPLCAFPKCCFPGPSSAVGGSYLSVQFFICLHPLHSVLVCWFSQSRAPLRAGRAEPDCPQTTSFRFVSFLNHYFPIH